MTHDPLCPARECCDEVTCDYCGGCRCELIAQVLTRAIEVANDQRSKFKARDWDDAIDAVVAALTQATVCDLSRLHIESAADESEDDRKTERDRAARAIVDSETFMWLMAGSEREAHYLRQLRRAYLAYCKDLDGGYARRADRQRNKPWLNKGAS